MMLELNEGSVCTILFLDDDEGLLRSAKRNLTSETSVVFTAATPEKALDIARERKLDVAVVDVVLKNASGIDALQQLKPMHPELFAIVISGMFCTESTRRAYRAGANDTLEKPFEWVELIDVIENGPPLPEQGVDELPTIGCVKSNYYNQVLNHFGGNVTKAAAWAGIHRTSFQRIKRKSIFDFPRRRRA